jgi:hypothetical protein
MTQSSTATWTTFRPSPSGPTEWATSRSRSPLLRSSSAALQAEYGRWYEADNDRLDKGEPERTVVIDRPYIETKAAAVREQLVKAWVRLGALLDEAL